MNRWKHRPEGSNWGDFGPEDRVGRLNLITPDRRRQAALEVREGLAFALSLPLDYPRGVSALRHRKPPQLLQAPGYNCRISSSYSDVACDDSVEIALQYSTQWDALGHIGSLFDADGDGVDEIVYYNGFQVDASPVPGLDQPENTTTLGIENMASTGVQGRGVMVNLFEEYGQTRIAVGYDALMTLFDRQKAAIEAGDILCLYSGLADLILQRGNELTKAELIGSCAVLDGRDDRLLRWIDDSGVSAIASDTLGVEEWGAQLNSGDEFIMPLHHLCLFKLGIHLGELWYFEELAAWLKTAGRTRFLLTAPPLMLPGAVGSPVTPVGTV